MLSAMQRRWLAGAWMLMLLTAVLWLERFPPRGDSFLGRCVQAEPVHLVAHALLYGTLAALLAGRWFPAEVLDAPDASLRRRALAAGATFLLAASAQELVQAVARGRGPGVEEYFDLTVDVAGAALGMIAWAAADRRRRYLVARALGVVLHPAALGPLGMYAVLASALGDRAAALRWTSLGVLATVPVAALWAVGLRG